MRSYFNQREAEMNYSGIDLHSNNSVVSVMDEQDRVVAEKRLPNDLSKILAFLSPWREAMAGVVVETTFNGYWLVDGLQAAGYTVHLANTVAIKKYEGLKHNTKNGNKYLSWAFVEAANFALRYCAEAKRFYERKKAKTNTVVAIKALAHKLARACFHILKEKKPFDVKRCFA